MRVSQWHAVCVAALAVLLVSCGRGSALPGQAGNGARTPEVPDTGLAPVPGEPTLSSGARIVPDRDAEVPLPRTVAQAGVDFASNRFIVIFENQPSSQAIAPYLDGDAPGTGSDLVSARDNAPLVQHPFLRKVSHNLAAKYGVSEFTRVFYKEVNYAAYEVPTVKSVADLDAIMLKVLNENPGLVREVCYDFYMQAVGGPSTELDAAKIQDIITQAQQQHAVASASTAPAAANTTVRQTSAPPTYDNPDPYYLNQPGSNTNTGDGGNDSGTWALWRVGATLNEAWSYTTGSSSVIICVADTGVRYTHEDIVDNCIEPAADPPYNAPGILTDVINKDNDPWDGHSHGTFCAGEIGAKGNNGKGLAGVCWNCTILPVKVLSDGGSGSDAQVAEGMLLADYLGANIISMSLGGFFGDRTTQLASKQCNTDGVLICAAAGNSNTSAPFYPAYYPECLAVGASTLVNSSDNEDFSTSGGTLPIASRFDAKASFSMYGSWVDIASPGVLSLSISNSGNSNYAAGWAGTSMATPIVSGCAGLLWSYISNPTNDKVRGLLQGSSTSLDHLNNGSNPKGYLDNTTNGTVRFVNVYQALQLSDAGTGTAPTLSWDNPANGATVSGVNELRVSVSGGSGSIRKVEFETFGRLIGTQTSPSGGFYKQNWDSSFEFNKPIEIRAKAYDDKGNIVKASITVTPNNSRKTPTWTEDFESTSSNAIPSGWFTLEGNQGSGNTAWGVDTAQFVSGTKSMHTSGTTANYGGTSNDYLYAPLIDLKNYASATLQFQRRYQMGNNSEVFLLASTDDKTYDIVDEFWQTSLQNWTNYTINLAPYAGKEVRIIWALTSGSGGPGLWLDDINLSAAAGTAPTIQIDSPANGASVNGRVPVNVTVSDDTKWISIYGEPPDIGQLWFTPIPDNDGANPTKTYTINWDSRHTYNGAGQLTLYAWDDEDNDNNPDDFSARAAVSVSVTNATRNPVWYEGFEGITTLGGFSGNNFDGDWYVWQSGTNTFRITSTAGQFRTGSKGCKFGPSGSGNYGANEFAQMYSPVHDCSTATRPYLRFWQQLDVENGGGDVAKLVLVQYDGLEDVEMPISELKSDTSPAGQWKEVDINLATWKARKFRFNFIFSSDNDTGAGNVGAGWFIDDYEVLDANPSISSLSPARGQTASSVTINGARFGNVQGSSTVTFAKSGGGRTSATVTSWSNTAIVVTVPANAQTGDVIVNVLGYDSAGSNFKVILAPPSLGAVGQL